ncbi:SH3 domain-containing protein [Streptomyces sp. NPDC090022]|uniref:SH3 domain-containing protein n=1 Tax=Streptomyces sp. NPDC090022 TaxID=3365920 RepID=UPI00380259F7
MLTATRTSLALAAGSLVLGLVGAGVAVADDEPPATAPGQAKVLDDGDEYEDEEYGEEEYGEEEKGDKGNKGEKEEEKEEEEDGLEDGLEDGMDGSDESEGHHGDKGDKGDKEEKGNKGDKGDHGSKDEGYGDDEEPTDHPKHRPAYGKVVSTTPLKIRSKPTTESRPIGQVYPHEKLELKCKKHSEPVDGNKLWYRLHGEDGWVAARYVRNLTPVKWCY